jgi:cyd operon protein YbgT
MWYFTWILGIGVALAFGLINALWLEAAEKFETAEAGFSENDKPEA